MKSKALRLIAAGLLGFATTQLSGIASAQDAAERPATREAADRSDEGFDMGWLGLLGLAGLVGLAGRNRRDRVQHSGAGHVTR